MIKWKLRLKKVSDIMKLTILLLICILLSGCPSINEQEDYRKIMYEKVMDKINESDIKEEYLNFYKLKNSEIYIYPQLVSEDLFLSGICYSIVELNRNYYNIDSTAKIHKIVDTLINSLGRDYYQYCDTTKMPNIIDKYSSNNPNVYLRLFLTEYKHNNNYYIYGWITLSYFLGKQRGGNDSVILPELGELIRYSFKFDSKANLINYKDTILTIR